MNIQKRLKSLLFAGLGAASFASLQASTVVFTDTFADNDRTVDPSWFTIGPPAAVVINQNEGVLSMGRTASNSHTYLASNWAGTTLAVGDVLTFTFNTVTFGYYNRNTANFLDVDSISVTYSPIPEPSSYAAFFGLGALLLFLRSRLRK